MWSGTEPVLATTVVTCMVGSAPWWTIYRDLSSLVTGQGNKGDSGVRTDLLPLPESPRKFPHGQPGLHTLSLRKLCGEVLKAAVRWGHSDTPQRPVG